MEAFDGCFLDRPVHPFNLPVRFGDWDARAKSRHPEAGPLLDEVDPKAFITGTGYEADLLIEKLEERQITSVISSSGNRRYPRKIRFAIYNKRNEIERFFVRLKQFRGIAIRYDRLKSTFLAAVQFSSAIIGIN
ncbi:transposase [Gluconobacter sp. P5E10]|uniref:transposase n=1 Tax=Gluconobacter sp. P5E10 TaxID=2762613 RepID=UPI00207B5A6E|nr:transposase [Gluconobacter sp. P5E10]